MTVEQVDRAIESLQGYQGNIGIMGGEPTMHPDFRRICFSLTNVPKSKRSLWTNGYKMSGYKDVIDATFLPENIIYNPHKDEEDTHQPLEFKVSELVDDKELMWKLIMNCWVQWRWSASIIPIGKRPEDLRGYFCEVAAALDLLNTGGKNGMPLDERWWDKDPNEFLWQVEAICPNCSGCVPMEQVGAWSRNKVKAGKLTREDIDAQLKKRWRPYEHRKVITNV